MQQSSPNIQVATETGRLRRLLIHSPDSGLGKVVPSKAQDWLFEDIVHLDTIRKDEYDYYVKLLMYFLDPEKIKGKLKQIDDDHERSFYKPGHPKFHQSDCVIEVQNLLADILLDNDIKSQLVAAICTIESCTYQLQQQLLDLAAQELAEVLISGCLADDTMIFPPVPNLIFTRDVGITINDHILLNKPAKKARVRENMLMRYIFFNHRIFSDYQDKIIEIPDPTMHFLRPGDEPEYRTTLEGGDVMMVSPKHLLIGVSERTSEEGANEAIKLLFERAVVDKVTVVKIPAKRDYMHLDTVFTQVKANTWVILHQIAHSPQYAQIDPIHFLKEPEKKESTSAIQFLRNKPGQPKYFEHVEALLNDISQNDLGCTEPTQIIYSGNHVFPYDSREQWTDSCNLLALKEGVVVGYDRNDKTIEAFVKIGFRAVKVQDLLQELENGTTDVEHINNTIILMPSAELSRARGGFHCMSMPLLRD